MFGYSTSCLFVIFFQQKVCLRYDDTEDTLFLHEAKMANVLRHKNILPLYGVATGSSFTPTFALVSLTINNHFNLNCLV